MPTDPVNWSDLDRETKSKLLSDILTYAATHQLFRDCCLNSSRAAQAAIEKAMNDGDITPKVIFPPDFLVEFVNTADCEEVTDRLVIKIPDYNSKNEGQQIEPIPVRDYVLCTYARW